MAEQILIDEGKKVLLTLINAGISLSFAVWYSDPSAQNSYFALGAKQFDEDGPSESYEKILTVLSPIKGKLVAFKADFIKLVPLESELGKLFLDNFSDKSGDTIIGMFTSTNYILYQVYAYGLK